MLTQNNYTYPIQPSFNSLTKLEKELMAETAVYTKKTGLETLRIIRKNKDITKYFDIYETENNCSLWLNDSMPSKVLGINFGFAGQIFNMKRLLKNAIYVHSHPKETPLSPTDIVAAIGMKVKKMIAVTPSEDYTSIELNYLTRRKAKKYLPIFDSITEFIQKAKDNYGENWIENEITFNEYVDLVHKKLLEFCTKSGVKFEFK